MSTPRIPERLVIAGASTRSAAHRARLAGFSVFALDQFLDRDLRAVAAVEPLPSLSTLPLEHWESWMGSPVLLCGGMENRGDVVDLLASRGLICSVDSQTLSRLRDPTAWARWSTSSGIGFPETRGHHASVSPSDACSSWLVKSYAGAGGLGVRFWRGESLPPSEYLQRHLAGEVLGVAFLSDCDGTRCVGCATSWSPDSFWGPLPFIYRGSVAPRDLGLEDRMQLEHFAHGVREEIDFRGIWQADFVRNEEGWWLLEINPRWSSSMDLFESVSGVSLVADHVAAVMGRFGHESRTVGDGDDGEGHRDRGCVGKVVRYAVRDFQPSATDLERWWGHRWDGTTLSLRVRNRLADIPAERSCIPAGYPICTEYAWGETETKVLERLRESVMERDIAFGK